MPIYLNAEVISGLGEDTFWTWMKRELGNKAVFGQPNRNIPGDVTLQYSTKGAGRFPGQTIALLWELHPEMKRVLGGNDFDHTLGLIRECAKTSAKRTVTSHLMVKYYQQFGQIDILPVGVNTDLFKPVEDKAALRRKYGIPENRKVGFWCGTTHPMKGFDKLVQYKNDNPDINWVIVWKQKGQDGNLPGAHNYTHVDQQKLSELMACSDFILCCGLLQPFFMVEWEAMACNLPVIVLDSIEKDFAPSTNPRDDVFRLGWDRKTALQTWKKYIGA